MMLDRVNLEEILERVVFEASFIPVDDIIHRGKIVYSQVIFYSEMMYSGQNIPSFWWRVQPTLTFVMGHLRFFFHN